MEKEISRLKSRSPNIPFLSPYSTHSPYPPSSSRYQTRKTRKILFYCTLSILIAAGIFIWWNQLSKIKAEGRKQLVQIQKEQEENLRQYFKKSTKNSLELIVAGRKYLLDKNRPDLALFYFERAAEIDPDYRDAHFYLGYSYLKIYENERSDRTNGTSKAIERVEHARDAFLKAKDRDPLYAPTYEFLAYTYGQLGDAQNAELCYNKYKELSGTSG